MRWALKIKIVTVCGSQVRGARAMEIGESRLSFIINGHVDPSPKEKETFKRVLSYDIDAPENPRAA